MVFLGDMNIWMEDWESRCGTSSSPLKAWVEQRLSGGESVLAAQCVWAGTFGFSCPRTQIWAEAYTVVSPSRLWVLGRTLHNHKIRYTQTSPVAFCFFGELRLAQVESIVTKEKPRVASIQAVEVDVIRKRKRQEAWRGWIGDVITQRPRESARNGKGSQQCCWTQEKRWKIEPFYIPVLLS